MNLPPKNLERKVIAVIPARHQSTRLANKLLLLLNGKPLILHTLAQTKKAVNVSRVIVATDDERIFQIIKSSGNEVMMTSADHQSGSDRIAEVAANLPENSIIVNVQGDEPLISPRTVEKAVEAILADDSIEMATTCEKIIAAEDVLSSDVVKVVVDENDFALYFSRSPIPFPREAVRNHGTLENALRAEPLLISVFRKHTGLYVYRREFLLRYTRLKQTILEKTEMLEQLRALENGARIKVVETSENSIGVDTAEDFARVQKILHSRRINYRRAVVEDVAAVAEVQVESWRKSFAGIVPQSFLDSLTVEKRAQVFRERFNAADYKMFVAETEQNKIVGFADFGKPRETVFDFEAELYAIFLLAEFQGAKIGEHLFRLCHREMIANDINSMYLMALAVSPFQSFYKKMGGQIVDQGRYFSALPEYETLVYGWKNLRENK